MNKNIIMVSVLLIFKPLLIGPLNENSIQKVIILNHLLYVFETIAKCSKKQTFTMLFNNNKRDLFKKKIPHA